MPRTSALRAIRSRHPFALCRRRFGRRLQLERDDHLDLGDGNHRHHRTHDRHDLRRRDRRRDRYDPAAGRRQPRGSMPSPESSSAPPARSPSSAPSSKPRTSPTTIPGWRSCTGCAPGRRRSPSSAGPAGQAGCARRHGGTPVGQAAGPGSSHRPGAGALHARAGSARPRGVGRAVHVTRHRDPQADRRRRHPGGDAATRHGHDHHFRSHHPRHVGSGEARSPAPKPSGPAAILRRRPC